MRRLSVFNHVSLDGYFTDAHGDMSFAHRGNDDPEWDAFVAGNASGGGMLLFGRVTYEMMASFWPTPAATAAMPVVAERMNNLSKVVFSRTLAAASWQNTQLIAGDIAAAVHTLKQAPGPDMAILGSGSIVAQLAQHGLIDDYQFVVNPLALGKGRTLFADVAQTVRLSFAGARTFRNGNVLLSYTRPMPSP